ncbi:hypothetical protein SY88_19365 [Clostridiales bacterium PH28_bin88]|nr:hypothetical protein SY88_19365 [Clostridiales bacterium PH28_bin88]
MHLKWSRTPLIVVALTLFTFLGTALASVTYTVKAGDSLYGISQKFGVSTGDIQKANNLKSTAIYPGQQLQIPTGGTTYTVQPGDSLYLIAKKFGVPVEALKKANGLTGSDIRAGQKLVIPSGSTGSVSGGTTYVVRSGDTLYKIGERFGVPYREIMRANGLSTTTLTVGQKLYIPSSTTTSAASTASRSGTSRPEEGISVKDLNLLARLVYGESRGEPYKGQVAVAAVVLNRVKSDRFPNTISGVIYQPGAFDAVRDGQIYLEPDKVAYQAARDAANGWDPSGGALYYWNPATATSKWIWSRPITTQIGNHVFAK